jgi:phosphate uptake regulator
MALGKSSLVVSLPKDWVRSNNLRRGDSVAMDVQRDLSLVIHPTLKPRDTPRVIKVNIDAEEHVDSIFRTVIGCYLNGYTNIELRSNRIFSVAQQTAIRNVVKSLYMRIISSNASSVVLQTLMNESMADIFSGIERMHLITLSMCNDVVKAMEEWDHELARSVISLEEDVDQFMFFLLRLIRCAAIDPSLATKLGIDMLDCLDLQTLVDLIERVADNVYKTADSVIQLEDYKDDIPAALWGTLIQTTAFSFKAYENALEVFRTSSVEESGLIIDQQYELLKLARSITPFPMMQNSTPFFYPLFIIRESALRIGDYAADIAEVTIDKAFKPSK